MLPSFSALPTWYLLVVAYTGILGVFTLRHQATVAAGLKAQESVTTDPRQRGQLAGVRAGGWTRACGWLLAAALLLTGRWWASTIVALAYALSARRTFTDYSHGFAEGVRAADLAAAPEYVRGRVVPGARDRAVALLYVLLTRLLPLGALLVAIRRNMG